MPGRSRLGNDDVEGYASAVRHEANAGVGPPGAHAVLTRVVHQFGEDLDGLRADLGGAEVLVGKVVL